MKTDKQAALTFLLFESNEAETISRQLHELGHKIIKAHALDGHAVSQSIITSLAAGELDVALFTNPSQVISLLDAAKSMGMETPLRKAFYNIAISSNGPEVTKTLSQNQLFADCDFLQNDVKNQLVDKIGIIVDQKRSRQASRYARSALSPQSQKTLSDSPIMKALNLEKTDNVPIWLMRQAGRYMAEYQSIRSGQNFKDFCKNIDKTVPATLDAADRLGVDAAIIFSDILLILEPMGLSLDYLESKGPVIANPLRGADDIKKLKKVEVETAIPYLYESIRLTRKALRADIPLIGFCGAPFTMASYMIEGGSSKQFIKTKKLMYSEPKLWHQLMELLVLNHIDYLRAQVSAGCDALQIFDSWAGHLTPEAYREFVMPYTRELISSLDPNIPVIHFGSFGEGMLMDAMRAGGNCISLDWKINIENITIPSSFSVQGNLDPTLLFCKPEIFLKETARILEKFGNRLGFIFNLGHGILPETPVDHVIELVDFVHNWGKQS